jgi:hypothetical protein
MFGLLAIVGVVVLNTDRPLAAVGRAVTHRDKKPRAPGGAPAGDYGGGAHPARAVLAIMSGLPSVLQRSEVA